jgi:hypothetical protein
MTQVDTSKVVGHRGQRYTSPADMHADVAALVGSERAGVLSRVGNWTLGQALGHLASWVDFAFDGYPIKPPFFVRWLLKGQKQKFLRQGLPRGVRIPRVKGGTVATELLDTEEGLRRFNAAWARLESTPPTQPNPIFGPLAHEEWVQMHLRHAELHLGYFAAAKAEAVGV